MTLASGRTHLAIPGPSVFPEAVLRAMHRTAPNIYEGELPDMVPGIVEDLKAIARTRHHVAVYIANGHGAWEAAVSNVFSRGDKVLVMATGSFGLGWASVASGLGLDVEIMDFGKRSPVDPDRLADRLAQDKGGQIKAVLSVQVDTATGVRNDVPAMRAALDKAGHPALLMIDCIACLACDAFEMDEWGVDVMVAASQKGLMTPPGLGFVFFNDRADAARDGADCATPYWDWRPRSRPEIFYQYFGGTAPTNHLYGLRVALDMIRDEGLISVWQRHAALAQAVWSAVDHWGQDGPLEINAPSANIRSNAVTAVRAGSAKGTELRQWCETRAGLTLGIGLGLADPDTPEWHHNFRIGHMGHVNATMVLGTLATIEAGLKAVGIAHQPGGAEAAAQVIAAQA